MPRKLYEMTLVAIDSSGGRIATVRCSAESLAEVQERIENVQRALPEVVRVIVDVALPYTLLHASVTAPR